LPRGRDRAHRAIPRRKESSTQFWPARVGTRAGQTCLFALLLPWWDQGLVQLTLLGAGELLPSAVNPNEVEAPPPRPPL